MADEENKSGEGKNAGGGPIHVDSAGGGYYADMEKVQEMIAWARARVLVAGYDKSMWTEDHDKTMSDFLLDPAKSLLILYVKKDEDVLVCKGGNMLPDSNQFYEAQFFVRNPSESLTPNTINRVVQYGVFSPDSIDSLLRVMDGIYVPFVVGNTTLPGSVRRSLTSQMHRFMAHLTETSYQTKGRTVLYLPQESIDLTDTDTVLEDKDLVQRLESTVIRWTRQIKEVINLQDNSQDAETAGPLDEINFWSERTVDLSGIREQLHDRTVLRIAELLKHVKSTYLKSFEDLSATIHEGSNEAEDNLKFLNCLRPVCEEIEKSSPPEVVALLPKLLKVIRMIWNVSGHYNRQERLTGLLRKVSNQIMARCCDYIPLSGVFDQDGDVQTSIDRLRECIACGEAWRVEYEKTKAAISRSPKTKDWSFPSESGIFAQIDAFVQRCKDLDEVCQGKIQFAPKPRSDLPVFGGVHGNEIVRGILGVSKQFESHMEKMRSVKYNVLDVKVTQWHSDFNVFKQSIKDLEVMMGNVMNSAFESVGSLKDAVDLLEAFECLSTKENVKRSLEKKTEHVIGLFLSQLQTLRQQFDKNNTKPPVQTSEPKFSGAAVWARGIRDLVEELWANLKKSKHWLPRVRQWSEARTNYEQFIGVLGQYIERKYNDWYESLESLDHGLLNEKLEAKLIVKNKVVTEKTDPVRGIVHDVKNHLSSNFDHDLIQLFNEVRLWGEFDGINIPYVAHDIAGQQKERLRVVRAGVSMVVRLYNTIIDDLAENERRLFSESDLMNDSTALPKFFERRLFSDHIRKLDRRIAPGIFKLNWTSKNVKEWFIQNWTDACRETTKIVASYKDGMAQIKQQCRLITNTQLVLIEKNVIYEDGEFESKQKTHRESVKAALKAAYATISETMKQLYSNFEGQPPEVQKEWRHLKYLVDKKVEKALRETARRSLLELSRAINGDSRTDPQPLFSVHVVLENSQKIEFSPTIISLTEMVNKVSKYLLMTIKTVPRIFDEKDFAKMKHSPGNSGKAKSFFEAISGDDDILKILVNIMNGMSACGSELHKVLSYWDKYKSLWEMDREAFIRRYAKGNKSLGTFESDIQKHRDTQLDIQNEDVSDNINFIQVDYSDLKAKLIAFATDWQGRLTGLLNDNAKEIMNAVLNEIESSTEQLTAVPLNLDELSDQLLLLEGLEKKADDTEASFDPLEKMYASLNKFDVQITDEETAALTNLRLTWAEFKMTKREAAKSMAKSKQNMRENLLNDLSNYNSELARYRKDAKENLPYHDGDLTPTEAFEKISQTQRRTKKLKNRGGRLVPGLNIFDLEPPAAKQISETEGEIVLLESIWGVADSFEKNWAGWKDGVFRDLDTQSMEQTALQYKKKVTKLGREIKKWKTFHAVKDRVEQFLKTLPLITDLRNEAMRSRHWDSLRAEIKKDFDPHSENFTLEQVFSLGLNLHSDFIAELSSTANKELNIETALAKVAEDWKEIDILMGDHKGIYYKVKDVEDLTAQLEDNQVTVSTMKASRFYKAFQKQIDYWENTLSLISEVVEMLLTVQRQWMYLESIFMASEDIQKQLPNESKMFDEINTTYKIITERINDRPNALKACQHEGMLENLTETDEKLQKIQKELDAYLETKRMVFPRFYFLSNDDLLEILGQQKDPLKVQMHIKKCFIGIKTLQMIEPHSAGYNNPTVEAKGMNSPCSEQVPYNKNVVIDGPVELWLIEVEKMMVETMAKWLKDSLVAYRGSKIKDKWVKTFPGQLLITTCGITWTADCDKALKRIASGNRKAMKHLKKSQGKFVTKLAALVRGNISKLNRKKTVALITMEIHARDTQDKMIKADCASAEDFEWLMQLRFTYHKNEGEFGNCVAHSTNAQLEYSYEYQGNNGRLVVTPLTDRCILTMVNALYLCRGGNPLGPAGTGKTETVKDLGKNLAKFVVVFNCSDGLDYKSVGRMFAGLVQSGGWGCFDEFNRIEIEVLSVVAQQILSIMDALVLKKTHFLFEGTLIKLNPSLGIFITMNPGYAGRTELPDNLKALMRPCAMMVPDLTLIAEVMLAAEGFDNSKALAKKVTTLYSLMIQQLTKQDHYDYGLRSLKAVLNSAGAMKREDPNLEEDKIVLRALRDMNVPKFIRDDNRLFRLLLRDLFPDLELPVSDYGKLQVAIERELRRGTPGIANGIPLQVTNFIVTKTIQLFESKAMRHCNMLVGATLAGKSTAWRILAQAYESMAKEDKLPGYVPVKPIILNPKSLSLNEIYGAYDLATFEWADGVLSKLFRDAALDNKPVEKWILLDGPVDTLWIESMNSVMDDNKVLTLINGDRIEMSNSMSLLFEVLDLAVASPATVSRAGMVYMDVEDLGWRPFVMSWLDNKFQGEEVVAMKTLHSELFDKYVDKVLDFKSEHVAELVPVSDFNAVKSLCTLYDTLTKDGPNYILEKSEEINDQQHKIYIEKWFAFCMVWSIGASATAEGRKKIDYAIRDIDSLFPPAMTVFDYYVDNKAFDWKPWNDKVSKSYAVPKDLPFSSIIVPTLDTVRNSYCISALMHCKINTLIVGNTGVGKTVLMSQLLGKLPPTYSKLEVIFSSATTSNATQNIIESVMEKRSKEKFGPSGGKKLVCFVDDFNMPKKDLFGSQPPLELLRQWIDYGCWYDREKQTLRYIIDTQLLAAMGPPGGGRSVITSRIQSRFNVINFTDPADAQLQRMFERIISSRITEFDDEIKPLGVPLVQATIAVYKNACEQFLPTPTKAHYLFNLRDPAKVVQGILRATPIAFGSSDQYLQLWIHECLRVFADRLADLKDKDRFIDILDDQLTGALSSSWSGLCEDKQGPIITDLLSEPEGEESHGDTLEILEDFAKLKLKMEEDLEDYNVEPGFMPMNLVLFRDAIGHLMRIQRILKFPRGNAMLIGVGGSGRQSQTRLAAYTAEMTVFMIEITKTYRKVEFHDDLKKLYDMAGVQNKKTVFLFNDTQLKEENFLEDINNMLSSGQVPNLFLDDEKVAFFDAVAAEAKKKGIPETPGNLWDLFVDRVRRNLHIVVCMSPVGDDFSRRVRLFPSLVNCTTIDWFLDWPVEALTEVAARFLEEERNLESAKHKSGVATVFGQTHESVVVATADMLKGLKRFNYVTPTSFLELVKGYRQLLGVKRDELLEQAKKLKNGVGKLIDAKEQVEVLSDELAVKQIQVDKAQKDCEEMLVVIVNEKRTADEKKKQVEAETERISKEEIETKAIADDCERDLGAALPALERAMAEVDKLDKGSITEVKSFSKPPPLVATVMGAVMVLFGCATDWASAKKKLGESDFLKQIKGYDKDKVSTSALNKIKKYCNKPEFTPPAVTKVSVAAGALCTWVCAIKLYCEVAKTVQPKRNALAKAMSTLKRKQAALAKSQAELAEVVAKVTELQNRFDTSVGEKNRLRDEAAHLQAYLERAAQLVGGLAGERERWQKSIAGYEEQAVNVVGDALIAAAFVSYAGVFPSDFRAKLTKKWSKLVKMQELPTSDKFHVSNFLANQTDVREWNIDGLPKDDFSTENGVLVMSKGRWPLMIDPQTQGNKWIKKKYGDELKIIDLKMSGYLRTVENSIQFGFPLLLQDVEERLDPALEPVLSKAVIKKGNSVMLKLGDKELDFSPDFSFFITTRLANPHYPPELCTKVTLVNFVVKEEGLEAQLLGIVVQFEEPSLEVQKSEMVVKVAAGKRKLLELEDAILSGLSNATGSLLDDEELVTTLQDSQKTSVEVTEQLQVAEATEIKIDEARNNFKSVSIRASILFFVLNDMSSVDPMYQFSLDSYSDLFTQSIEQSHKLKDMERLEAINHYHTLAVYESTCRGLFERHKILFSFQMTIKILQNLGKVSTEEYQFFLKGPQVLDRSLQKDNPCSDWLQESSWDGICELDKLSAFTGITNSFDQNPREWKILYESDTPETETLPGEWEGKVSDLQRMCIVRCLRMDRLLFAVTRYVAENQGPQFVDPPAFNLGAIYKSSTFKTPLVFVLSPGVDPTKQLTTLAADLGQTTGICALGQGQGPRAESLLDEGVKKGSWVFLANCHLMLSWMPILEKRIDMIGDGTIDALPEFRLWLSSNPDPKFPITILQAAIKITTEPPSGLRPNLTRMINLVSEEQFERCEKKNIFKPLLFSLCWFHAILIERRKFRNLGFNIPYEFNESDFVISQDVLGLYVDAYERTPWDALKYLISQANYGGRVTDELDARLIQVYISQFFNPDVLAIQNYPLSELKTYVTPPPAALEAYKNIINDLPQEDDPRAFGQHPNAAIASQISNSLDLLRTLLSLAPQTAGEGGETPGEIVLKVARSMKEQMPAVFRMKDIIEELSSRSDPDPLKTVLLQELDRYNKLLKVLQTSLAQLELGIQGLSVITPELEEVFNGMLSGQVPDMWAFAYPSLKPLGAWTRDLFLRIEQMDKWAKVALPKVFWFTGFTYPTGFLTALLQTCARKTGEAIDALGWEFNVIPQEENGISQYPKDGAYMKGIYLEGARWDYEHGYLAEPLPMELFSPMPIIHFKPAMAKKKPPRGTYSCPMYMYPLRTGTRERPSFVLMVHLKSGQQSSDFWIKRGTALLLSLAE
jgi:dynein heavy chain